MLNLVRTQNNTVFLKRCIAEEQGASTLYGIDARHGRAIWSEGIVVAIDDENRVGDDHGGHRFCLNVTGADRNEPFPASSFRGAPRTQMIEISRRKLNEFQNGTHSYMRFEHGDGLRYKSDVVC